MLKVPANSSRLFLKKDDALQQSSAEVQLIFDEENPYVYNNRFNQNLISYDFNYCTTDNFHFKDSIGYFNALAQELSDFNTFIEIGCGQGEFVEHLRVGGLNAFGFDPTLRNSSDYLFQTYWTIANQNLFFDTNQVKNPLYIMRCVLPHIPNPFDFLDSIFESDSNSGVLIEFQRREFIINTNNWTQISHDHVNIFSTMDFVQSYEILSSGEFANSEWAYVLLRKRKQKRLDIYLHSEHLNFDEVFRVRDFEIDLLANLESPIAIYGAAGKGIVFGFSLMNCVGGGELIAIDSDINRQNRFMECSGIKVISPKDAIKSLVEDTLIVVMNPSHFDFVSKIFAVKFRIATIGKIGIK